MSLLVILRPLYQKSLYRHLVILPCTFYILNNNSFNSFFWKTIRIEYFSHLSSEHSKAFEKSINNDVAESCFDFAPSIILRIVKICPIVHLFCLKPFWFFCSSGSNTGHILFSNIKL